MKTVNLNQALASFDEVYSPRIVARVNDYDVKIAHTSGPHLWHTHEDTDEFFLVLDGRFEVTLRDADGSESTIALQTGDTFVVPRGVEHRPSSPGGSVLMFEPAGTSSTGDSHEIAIPAHVDSTPGHELSSSPRSTRTYVGLPWDGSIDRRATGGHPGLRDDRSIVPPGGNSDQSCPRAARRASSQAPGADPWPEIWSIQPSHGNRGMPCQRGSARHA